MYCPICHEPLPDVGPPSRAFCLSCDRLWRPPYEAHEKEARVLAIGPCINPFRAEVSWWHGSTIKPDEPRWRGLFVELTMLPPASELWNPNGQEMSYAEKARIAQALEWEFAPTPEYAPRPVIRLRLYAHGHLGYLEGYPRLGGRPVWAVKERRNEPAVNNKMRSAWEKLIPRETGRPRGHGWSADVFISKLRDVLRERSDFSQDDVAKALGMSRRTLINYCQAYHPWQRRFELLRDADK